MGWKRLWISIEESTSDELRESMEIFSAGMRIRNELLKYKNKWKFSGSLTSPFEKPPQTLIPTTNHFFWKTFYKFAKNGPILIIFKSKMFFLNESRILRIQ